MSRFSFEQADRQTTDGEDLIGAQTRVSRALLMIAIDDVEKTPPRIVPEGFSERVQAAIE
jgi:hypothetical protein